MYGVPSTIRTLKELLNLFASKKRHQKYIKGYSKYRYNTIILSIFKEISTKKWKRKSVRFSSSWNLPSEGIERVLVFFAFCICYTQQIDKMRHFINCIHTPGNVGVSSKNVLFCSNYSNSMWLAITAVVECSWRPAVSRGAVTKLPNKWLRHRIQKSTEMTE